MIGKCSRWGNADWLSVLFLHVEIDDSGDPFVPTQKLTEEAERPERGLKESHSTVCTSPPYYYILRPLKILGVKLRVQMTGYFHN